MTEEQMMSGDVGHDDRKFALIMALNISELEGAMFGKELETGDLLTKAETIFNFLLSTKDK